MQRVLSVLYKDRNKTNSQKNLFSAMSIGLIILLFAMIFFVPANVQAQEEVVQCTTTTDCPTGASCLDGQCITDTFGVSDINENTSLGTQDIRVTIGKIIQVVLGLMGTVLVVLILYAGVTIMTAGGNPEKVTTGKKILTNATIGLAIILSTMGIVQFIFSRLSQATGSGVGSTTGGSGEKNISISQFTSGASLGSAVKETYPLDGQTDVVRNTKIAVTFSKNIDAGSLIENTNNTCWDEEGKKPTTNCKKDDDGNIIDPYYGDCLAKDSLDLKTDCDQLNTTSVQIFKRDLAQSDPLPVTEAMALAIYTKKDEVTTFSFSPHQLIGDDTADTWYRIVLTGDILEKPDTKEGDKEVIGKSVFENEYQGKYFWEFQTGTNADVDPPTITSISPTPKSTIARNIMLQVSFSEAIDPAVSQGVVGPDSPYNHVIFKNKAVTGEWKLVNGYRTMEFVSDQTCGQNSCGDDMYCLPVPGCTSGDDSCVKDEEILIRSGELIQPGGQIFSAKPFSGIADMAGNALDGNNNGNPDGRPAITGAKVISENEIDKKRDNYWLPFKISNTIDRSIPHIETITPDIDAQGVSGDDPIEITFNKTMSYSSLYDSLRVEEYPEIKDEDGEVDFFWNKLGATEVTYDKDKSKTRAMISHRSFGPAGQDVFYFVSVSSSAKAANGNCLYPGRGPKTATKACNYIQGKSSDCVPPDGYTADNPSQNDTGCVVGDGGDMTKPDVDTCVKELKTDVDTILKEVEKNNI